MTRPTIHPGEILADELRELGVSPTELARQLNVPANRVSQIINGKRAITGDTALRLGHWFRTSAEFWLHLQSAHDLRLAEEVAGAEITGLPVRPEPAAGALSRRLGDTSTTRRQGRTGFDGGFGFVMVGGSQALRGFSR